MKTHGMSGTRFYRIWNGMMMRCHNRITGGKKHYGARGIKVCKRWHLFKNFYEDMYPSYCDNLTLERKRVNSGYNKNNCEWVFGHTQGLNKRNTVRIRIGHKNLTAVEWSAISGESYRNIINRIGLGWNSKDAVYGKGNYVRMSDSQKDEVIILWKRGLTRRAIASQVGVWHSAVSSVIFRYKNKNLMKKTKPMKL